MGLNSLKQKGAERIQRHVIINIIWQMSIDKTLRLTEQSGSEILSILDQKLRNSYGSYSNEYLQHPKMTNSHSLKNLRTEPDKIKQLEYQNQMLRTEVISLRKQLKLTRQDKLQEVQGLQQQILKLKKLIEKSYYSLKVLQNQNINYREQTQRAREELRKTSQRNNFLDQKANQMFEYIQTIKSNHEKEMKLVWERVAHLQKNLEAVVQLIDQDKKEDIYYRNQLRTSRADSSSTKSFRFN